MGTQYNSDNDYDSTTDANSGYMFKSQIKKVRCVDGDRDSNSPNSSGVASNASQSHPHSPTSKEEKHASVSFIFDSLPVIIHQCSPEVLAMTGFIEEFSRRVGKDFLVKKSLLLIRAWWCNETSTYTGKNIKHYLDNDTMSLMVMYIFNRHIRWFKVISISSKTYLLGPWYI